MNIFLLLSAVLYAAGTVSTTPAHKKHTTPAANPDPTATTFTPQFRQADPVGLQDVCATVHSPAKNQTTIAFQAFRTARLYMLAAIINEEPTHSELTEASKWQLGETLKLLKLAKRLNKHDQAHHGIRRKWYRKRHRWLNFKIKVAKKLIHHGLPSWPQLAKVMEWFKKRSGKTMAKWKKVNARIDKRLGNEPPRKAAATVDAAGKLPVEPLVTPAGTPATVDDLIVHDEPVETKLTKAQILEKVEKETPPQPDTPAQPAPAAAGEKKVDAIMDKAVDDAVAKSLNKKKKKAAPYLPKVPLLKASPNEVSDEIIQKLGLRSELDVAKVDVLLKDIETHRVC